MSIRGGLEKFRAHRSFRRLTATFADLARLVTLAIAIGEGGWGVGLLHNLLHHFHLLPERQGLPPDTRNSSISLDRRQAAQAILDPTSCNCGSTS